MCSIYYLTFSEVTSLWFPPGKLSKSLFLYCILPCCSFYWKIASQWRDSLVRDSWLEDRHSCYRSRMPKMLLSNMLITSPELVNMLFSQVSSCFTGETNTSHILVKYVFVETLVSYFLRKWCDIAFLGNALFFF